MRPKVGRPPLTVIDTAPASGSAESQDGSAARSFAQGILPPRRMLALGAASVFVILPLALLALKPAPAPHAVAGSPGSLIAPAQAAMPAPGVISARTSNESLVGSISRPDGSAEDVNPLMDREKPPGETPREVVEAKETKPVAKTTPPKPKAKAKATTKKASKKATKKTGTTKKRAQSPRR